MTLIKVFLLILILFSFSSFSTYADEIDIPLETGATSTPEEIVPEEKTTETENTTTGNIEMFSESLSNERTEVSCWSDENENLWCDYSDGTRAIKTPNPFFAKLAAYDQTSNFLTLAASINGTTIQSNGPNYVPLNEPIDIKVSFSRSRENETFAPYQGKELVFNDVVNSSIPQFIFLKGEIGKAGALSTAQSASYGVTNFENANFTFTEPGHYIIVVTPGYYVGREVPGFTWAELCSDNSNSCSVPQFNYTHFLHFLTSGVAYQGNPPGAGLIDPVLYGVIEFDVLDISEAPSVSNVLFLPGIKGSKLWMGKDGCDFFFRDCDEEPLWPPQGHQDVEDLFLNSDGNSNNQVYTKKNEVLTSIPGTDFYGSFLDMLAELKVSGTMSDYEAIPYDWRLSIEDIINKGAEHNGNIFYEEATSTPYIKQELLRLVKTSKTGKVTIVAHSNGGLVAKGLLNELGSSEAARLVDNLIFVGVPQSGAPQAVGALLFGYREALPRDECSTLWGIFGQLCSILSSRDLARALAENSPMAYHLLPSATYFDEVHDQDHPLVRFSGLHAYATEFAEYGESIDSPDELASFLESKEGGRIKPDLHDIAHANVLNPTLINYGKTQHALLDLWVPPTTMNVYQLAGWGVDTISGIDFTEQPTPYLEYIPLYRPVFVEDGDGVVPTPSALMMPVSQNVKRFWINLSSIQKIQGLKREHSSLLSTNDVVSFIQNVLHKKDSLPDFFSATQPLALNESKKLRFILYAQASISIQDEGSEVTGTKDDGSIEVLIPDSSYDEFGSVKIVTIPANSKTYNVKIKAKSISEKITLDIEKVSNGKTTERSTVTNIPLLPEQIVSFDITPETQNTTPLTVEEFATSTPLISFEEGSTKIYGIGTTTTVFPPQEPSSGGTETSQETLSSKEVYSTNKSNDALPKKIVQKNLPVVGKIPARVAREETSKEEDFMLNTATSSSGIRTQTASVYDAFVNSVIWLKEMMYTIFSTLFSLLRSILKI